MSEVDLGLPLLRLGLAALLAVPPLLTRRRALRANPTPDQGT